MLRLADIGIRLVDRDIKIFGEIDRWRVIQGRHIKELAGFSGQRACDRRLRKLIQAGYIKRERILYGVAGIYLNTSKAQIKKGALAKSRKIRVEQIHHDIAVVDTAIFFNKVYEIEFDDMKTEIELHRLDGFGIRKHRPDFVFTDRSNSIDLYGNSKLEGLNGNPRVRRHEILTAINPENKNGKPKLVCVEVELSLKARDRFEKIIRDNFRAYDRQIWIVPDMDSKIARILMNNKTAYTNIEIMELSEIQAVVQDGTQADV